MNSVVVVTSPEHHNTDDGVYSVFVDGPGRCYGNLGEVAKWLVSNVSDKTFITFKGFGPKHAKATGKKFRDVGLDVLLECL